MANSKRILVIGGGAAGTGAATTAIQRDESLDVTLVTEFEDIAYSPCGIPYVFGGEIEEWDNMFLRPLEFYEDMGLDVHLETRIESIDIDERVAYSTEGGSFPFDTLILGLGWEYEVPDVPGVDLDGIIYIKNIRRAMELNERLDGIDQAVVWQSKPLGVELTEALPKRGIETHLVDSNPWLMADFTDPDMMEPLQEHLTEELGAHLHFETELEGFEGENGQLQAVRTSAGTFEADMAFLVAPMLPATELAESIGAKTGSTGALVVDNHMRTNVEGVYAAGACVETMHGLLETPVRLIPGTYAYTQGKVAGANAAGGDESYRPVYVPWGIGADVQIGGVLVSETIAQSTGMPYVVGKATGITAARYHPEHEAMHVKLLADPDTHHVIGAQFTGGDGVKERADFLAFAIRQETEIEELATMENVYSPPIGALGEPIAAAAQDAVSKLES